MSLCVFTDERQEAALGTLCRHAIVSFYPNAARKVEVIACLCGTFPRLDMKHVKCVTLNVSGHVCCRTLFWLCEHGL